MLLTRSANSAFHLPKPLYLAPRGIFSGNLLFFPFGVAKKFVKKTMASAAVAKVLPCQVEVSRNTFKGDDDRLLERMIEACQSRPSARLPGYGRQLVPFFSGTGDGAGQPLEHSPSRAWKRGDSAKADGRRHSKKKSPRKSANNARSGSNTSIGMIGSARALNPQVPSSFGPEVSEEGKSAAKKATVRIIENDLGSGACLASAGGRRGCLPSGSDRVFVPDATFAGPGYFLSPPPEALPMPTAFLLSRAMAVSY